MNKLSGAGMGGQQVEGTAEKSWAGQAEQGGQQCALKPCDLSDILGTSVCSFKHILQICELFIQGRRYNLWPGAKTKSNCRS